MSAGWDFRILYSTHPGFITSSLSNKSVKNCAGSLLADAWNVSGYGRNFSVCISWKSNFMHTFRTWFWVLSHLHSWDVHAFFIFTSVNNKPPTCAQRPASPALQSQYAHIQTIETSGLTSITYMHNILHRLLAPGFDIVNFRYIVVCYVAEEVFCTKLPGLF